MKHIFYSLILCTTFCCSFITYNATIIRGNNSESPFGFTQNVSQLKLNQQTGNCYVAFNQSGMGAYAISRAIRPNFLTVPTFKPIAQDNLLISKATRTFDLVALPNCLPLLAAIFEIQPTTITGFLGDGSLATQVIDPNNTTNTVNLNDALQAQTSGAINLALSASHVFVAIQGNDGASFGDNNSASGIALVTVEKTRNNLKFFAGGAIDTDCPDIINRAALFNGTITEIKETTNDALFTDENKVALCYDQYFNRLFIGCCLQTGTDANDIARSVVLARLVDATTTDGSKTTKVIEFEPIVEQSAIAGNNTIITAQGASEDLRALHIGIMHTSTGPKYLIINGGNGDTTTTNNQFFALPLVDDLENTSQHGSLAKKDSPLVNNTFVTPATVTTDLAIPTDTAALIGAGPFPIESTNSISQMIVLGDTVYAATAAPADNNNNDTGIFFSRAQFDSNGKIACWTPWTKRVIPKNAFGDLIIEPDECLQHTGPVSFFAVDDQTSNIWINPFIQDTSTNRVVGITNWIRPCDDNSLAGELNQYFHCGCYAHLDLDQETPSFLSNTAHRYALFGGNGMVAFAHTGLATDIDKLNSPQTPTTDFSNEENFLLTTLSNDASVRTLVYTQQNIDKGAINYFFAGTRDGLFAFTNQAQEGFVVTQLAKLDESPFASRSWRSVNFEAQEIKKLIIADDKLIVLAITPTEDNQLTSTVYSITIASPLSTMFDTGNIVTLAQTSVDAFEKTFLFTDIARTTTSENITQVVLATTNGLFTTTTTNGVTNATSQTTAQWLQIVGTELDYFNGISSNNTAVQKTIWPFSLINNQTCSSYFENGIIYQLNKTSSTTPQFTPKYFNNRQNTVIFDPIQFLWSDGARRLFITNNQDALSRTNVLVSQPFNTIDECDTTPLELTNKVFDKICHFYWIDLINNTGAIYAGANTGVVTLQ